MRDGAPPDVAGPARTAHRGTPVRGGRISRWVGRRILHRGQGPDRIDVAVLADVLRAAIDAGASIPTALMAMGAAVPGPQGRQFSRVAATLRLGGDWDAAWEHAEGDLRRLAGVLQPAWDDGVAPAALLRHAANDIRRRRAAAAREAAARLGVRLVLPMGLCWLPAFVLLGLAPVLLSTGGSLWP